MPRKARKNDRDGTFLYKVVKVSLYIAKWKGESILDFKFEPLISNLNELLDNKVKQDDENIYIGDSIILKESHICKAIVNSQSITIEIPEGMICCTRGKIEIFI